MKLVLGSSSPRRRELLGALNLKFEVESPDVDESRFPDEPPSTYVERIARAKALAVAGIDVVALAADTTVVLEGKVLGKPAHPEEARSMLRRLQGNKHEVITGLAVAAKGETHSITDSTEVEMLPMTDPHRQLSVCRYTSCRDSSAGSGWNYPNSGLVDFS